MSKKELDQFFKYGMAIFNFLLLVMYIALMIKSLSASATLHFFNHEDIIRQVEDAAKYNLHLFLYTISVLSYFVFYFIAKKFRNKEKH